MRKIVCILFLPALLLTACKMKYKCPTTVYCGLGHNFLFTGYSAAELDSVIMRVYKGDGLFTTLIDTGVIKQKDWLPLNGMTDSLLNGSMALVDKRIFTTDTSYVAYDWELYLPKQGRTYRVTHLVFTGDTKQTLEGCDHEGRQLYTACGKQLTAYDVDGKQQRNYTGKIEKYRYGFVMLKK